MKRKKKKNCRWRNKVSGRCADEGKNRNKRKRGAYEETKK
jgi:hypothetical protein